MPKKHKFNEKQLRDCGFAEGSDGVWRKESGSPKDPPSGGDPKPNKKRALQKNPQVARPPIQRFIALVTIRTVRPRDYDGLGASAKYYFDGLVHLGIIEDDSPEHLEIVYNPEKCGKYSEQETIIELFECPSLTNPP
jgi:hypothetical protein